MGSLLFCLSSMLSVNSFLYSMLTLSVSIPLSIMMLYKGTTYVEDSFYMLTPVGLLLVTLTLSLLMLTLLASPERNSSYYTLLQVIMSMLLVMCFTTNNLLIFYLLFEACLIPILLMIVNWGYQPERLQAGLYMVMYTVISSLPLLVIIIYLYLSYGTFAIISLSNVVYDKSLLLVLGVMAFLVKLPMYGLHVWLPKAHVEAPLGGSMVLAGVLLKLGGYGLYLYSGLHMMNWQAPLGLFIILLSLWGGVLASIICLIQVDIKALIAYSSIVHMSLITLGILSNTSWGLCAALITMVAHGWASSALFLMAFSTYQLVGSRSFSYSKGLLVIMPLLSMMWFLYCMVNMGFPPTINFLGEVMIVPVSINYSWKVFFPIGLTMFMSVAYNMYLYSQINHGPITNYMFSSRKLDSRVMLATWGHIMPMLLVFNLVYVL